MRSLHAPILSPYFSYKCTGEKLLKYQENSPWVIISLIFMTSGIKTISIDITRINLMLITVRAQRVNLYGFPTPSKASLSCNRAKGTNKREVKGTFQLFISVSKACITCGFLHPLQIFLSLPLAEPNEKPPVHLCKLFNLSESTFSNSVIIHEEKTKEITTVKVWKCGLDFLQNLGNFCFNLLQKLLMV